MNVTLKIKNQPLFLFKIIIILLFTFLPGSWLFAQNEEDSSNLNNVIETFKTAITGASKEATFYNLFLHDSITWATTMEGKTKEIRKSGDNYWPLVSSSFKKFFEYVKDRNCEEKFYNIEINQDNNFATIKFDYTFQEDDEILNWGKEHWTLLKVEGHWKITSVLWTTNLQDIEKSPFRNNSYYRE